MSISGVARNASVILEHAYVLFFIVLSISIILYKLNHTVCNLLGLAFLTQHDFLEIWHSCCIFSIADPCLLLNSIPPCGYPTSLFNRSPIKGHLSWFQFGAITSNTVLNIHVHVFT